MKTEKCPVCGSTNVTERGDIVQQKAAQMSRQKPNEDITEHLYDCVNGHRFSIKMQLGELIEQQTNK